jgi:hypothetical protein
MILPSPDPIIIAELIAERDAVAANRAELMEVIERGTAAETALRAEVERLKGALADDESAYRVAGMALYEENLKLKEQPRSCAPQDCPQLDVATTRVAELEGALDEALAHCPIHVVDRIRALLPKEGP